MHKDGQSIFAGYTCHKYEFYQVQRQLDTADRSEWPDPEQGPSRAVLRGADSACIPLIQFPRLWGCRERIEELGVIHLPSGTLLRVFVGAIAIDEREIDC